MRYTIVLSPKRDKKAKGIGDAHVSTDTLELALQDIQLTDDELRESVYTKVQSEHELMDWMRRFTKDGFNIKLHGFLARKFPH